MALLMQVGIIIVSLRSCNFNIGKKFVSSVVFLQKLLQFKVNNLWNDGVHLLESCKVIINDTLIHNIYQFLQITNQFIWNQ